MNATAKRRSSVIASRMGFALGTLGVLVGCGATSSKPQDSAGQQATLSGDSAAGGDPEARDSAQSDDLRTGGSTEVDAERSGQGGRSDREVRTDGEVHEFRALGEEDEVAGGTSPSRLKPSKTHAVIRFTVVDKDKGPIKGIVISLTAPDGTKSYTEETDDTGYTEVLVPAGQSYELVYLSLGRRDVAARIPVKDKPNLTVKLTLRYQRHDLPSGDGDYATPEDPPRFVLKGVHFAPGKATLTADSHSRLDSVLEFMTYTKSARIEISGHTDSVGKPRANKTLSEKRAQACRKYLISKGIDGSRITAVGYGQDRPVASNDTDSGRQQNRRIEAVEIP